MEDAVGDVRSRLVGGGEDYYEVLSRAFPDPPANMRRIVEEWEADERLGCAPVEDSLLDFLGTTHRLMRLAWEDR